MSDILPRLEAIVGSARVDTGEDTSEYRHDGSFLTGSCVAVVHPSSTAEVAGIARLCHQTGTPITARGSGTSLVGGPVPLGGGVILSLTRLTALDVDPENLTASAGAGVITADLQAAAEQHGLMYPPDPGSVHLSTIGGNIACNAGGMVSLKYGVTADYILGLTVVLANGDVLRLGGKTRKRASGYRLIQLFIGSEGTLGVVTEVTVKLIPRPRYHFAAMLGYHRLEDAGLAVSRALTRGSHPCALEIIDRNGAALLRDHMPESFRLDLDGVLIVEQDGNDEKQVRAELERMTHELAGDVIVIARDDAERTALWAARRHFGSILISRRNNYFAEDIAVPIGRIPDMIRRIETIGKQSGLTIATVGHAGDGNLHPVILFDDSQRHLVGQAAERIFRAAIELDGTISAEHGLGALKRDFSAEELGPPAMSLMRGIKTLLDPTGILNPHKMFPEQEANERFLSHLPGWCGEVSD